VTAELNTAEHCSSGGLCWPFSRAF
jgi:hypothetical protein